MARDLICICCPRGCHLHVDDDLSVTGNFCPRGAKYGAQEVNNPVRTLTSTIKVNGASLPLCPVKTKEPIPKGKIKEAMEEINSVTRTAPIAIGQTIIDDIAGTGVPLVSTAEIAKEEK